MGYLHTTLIAALTSAVVALIIEWAAKPQLEARKERILERHKAWRELGVHLARLAFSISLLDDRNYTKDEKENLSIWMKQHVDDSTESCRLAMDSLSGIATTMGRFDQRKYLIDVCEAIAGLVGIIWGRLSAADSTPDRDDVDELISLADMISRLYEVSFIRKRHHRELLMQAKHRLDPDAEP